MSEAVIVDAIRTPIGRAIRGTLRDIRADDLAAIPLRALMERNPEVDFRETDDVMMGCGFPDHEQGYNVARNATLLAGHRPSRPGGHGEPLLRLLAADDPDGVSRDQGGRRRPVHRSRRGMHLARRRHDASGDEPAARRHKWHRLQRVHPDGAHGRERGRALQGQPRGPGRVGGAVPATRGRGARERALRLPKSWAWTSRRPTTPGGDVIAAHSVTRDDGPRAGTTVEGLAKLKPAFKPNGTVTPGNACPLNDGAAAVLVMSEEKARERGVKPRARIVASAVAAIRPEIMGLGPIPACRKVLKQAGLKIDDIDVVELNEAFAAQVLPCRDELGIDPEKLNINGGAIALGHPFGMTGARIMTTLLNNLDSVEGRYGLESMCVAGGLGMAMIVERLY